MEHLYSFLELISVSDDTTGHLTAPNGFCDNIVPELNIFLLYLPLEMFLIVI